MEEKTNEKIQKTSHPKHSKRPTREESEKGKTQRWTTPKNLRRKSPPKAWNKEKRKRGSETFSSGRTQWGFRKAKKGRERKSGGRLNVLIDHAYHLHCLLVKKRTSDKKDLNEKKFSENITPEAFRTPYTREESEKAKTQRWTTL
ncbi:hypothetical protein TNIN_27771 [Trichonephila inaurata madagascariensis]|uniref:Uncharacterized protein n=1 Tax=Trichonephila inaurata madagascariensis TaxID=2747483 RepID=A0A8X6YEC2_9ARAC|nr:hypothetical protein TNIN_27771 [Trichonephila inaurata madagascariensis]